jgi:hypothetical protein
MNTSGPPQATFQCPQCHHRVRLTAALVPMPSGHLAVAVAPLTAALALHMRVGCTAR